MSLKLYHDLLSQPARALYIFLKQTGTPFESVFVNLMKGEHLKPGFAKLNAFKQIPIIEHDGFVLTESVAILRYLCREFKVDDHWYPKESKAQARVDEFLEWQHMGLRLHLVSYVRTKSIIPLITKKPARPEELKRLEGPVASSLDDLNNIWLKDNKPFLVSNKITVADIIGACEVEQLRFAGFDARKGRPQLTEWLDRVAKATSPHYQEAHEKIIQLSPKM
ncbi:glutathione S-transferase theta-1-like [Trichogramma pretiosum]|uniref:glutathione S-transferase theta-1-like n=1 Tax=Trichogramma pretiosum TaxID=7493 RepID=UPI0006C9809C|nr:glutathione S-transferase theta-1-like [Trichogramma pretiosum]